MENCQITLRTSVEGEDVGGTEGWERDTGRLYITLAAVTTVVEM